MLLASPKQTPEVQPIETFTRIERKLVVDRKRLGLMRAWLAHACRPAMEYPAGQVSSCYYDTPDMDEYFASVDGHHDKNKVRLRWYGAVPATESATAFLELKSKTGAATAKRRARLTVPAAALASEDFAAALPRETLNRYLLAFGHRPALDLRPTMVVTYHRYRFLSRRAELTLSLDSGIRAWLPAQVRSSLPVDLGVAVVEIKGHDLVLPPALRALRRIAPAWGAFSKYAAAVEALTDAPGGFRP